MACAYLVDMRPSLSRHRAALHWIPFIFLVALILVYSTDLLTGEAVCNQIHDVTVVIRPDAEESGMANLIPFLFRKVAHASLFLLLGLSSYPLAARGEKGQWLAYIVCAATALCSELLQATTPDRSPEFRDVVLNLASCSVGFGWVCYVPAWLPPAFRKVLAAFEGPQPATPSLTPAASLPGHQVRLALFEILDSASRMPAEPGAALEPDGEERPLPRPRIVGS